MIFVLGVLAGLLVASLITNIAQLVVARRSVAAALQHETRLLDRAAAAELRAAQQIDAMLERISTAPRLEVRPGAGGTLSERTYIADTPDMDEAWNEYKGIAEDDE